MKLSLHHVNLCSDNIERLDEFYKDVLGLEEPTHDVPYLEREKGVPTDAHFRSDGNIQFHIASRDEETGFRTGHIVNPLAKGHIAFRTDDLEAFKQRLEEKNIPYSDYGHAAVKGWHQIFFYDPDGTVIEVHQIVSDDA